MSGQNFQIETAHGGGGGGTGVVHDAAQGVDRVAAADHGVDPDAGHDADHDVDLDAGHGADRGADHHVDHDAVRNVGHDRDHDEDDRVVGGGLGGLGLGEGSHETQNADAQEGRGKNHA